jgi:RimJ/RimL family protein N-acetyltransferase
MLETERLILKPVEQDDLEGLLELQWDKNLMTYMIFNPLSMENQKEWIKSLGKSNIAFSIFLKEEGINKLIGLATLNQINHIHQRASWGLKLTSNIQSKGIGFESSLILIHFAFANLNMAKIHGDILEENIANRKMCAKLGVREEGVLVNHYYQSGSFRNVVLVGMLKEEFYEKNSEKLKELGLM